MLAYSTSRSQAMPDAPDAHTAAMDRGAALLQDLDTLRTLLAVWALPEVQGLTDPEAHIKALHYLLQQSVATMTAMLEWHRTNV
jgi:hypothetical protein